MNYLKQFKIPFKGLSLGVHDYDWALDKKFFDAIENPDVLDCRVDVLLNLEMKERMMILDFTLNGNITVSCDRCMEEMELPIQLEEQYFIKLGEELMEESESVLVIPENEYQIDVSSLVYDFISLAIPIRKTHPENQEGKTTCNAETLSMLNELSHKETTDPRWDALKNIKLDNNQ